MSGAHTPPVQERYERALSALTARLEDDPHVLAAILFGSLSYDVVWERSDIDLMLVVGETRRSRPVADLALVEGDVNIHAFLQTRDELKKMLDGSRQGSFLHAALSRGRLLFSRDDTLRELLADLGQVGARDLKVQLFHAAASVIPCLDKAEKFLVVKRDPAYASVWLNWATSGLARIEVLRGGAIPGREVIQQALALNPEFFDRVYTRFLDRKKTDKNVRAVLGAVDGYLLAHVDHVFGPLLDHLDDAGTPRSATELGTWFQNEMGIEGVVTACEWLAAKGIVDKGSAPVRLTRRSRAAVDELAFFYTRD